MGGRGWLHRHGASQGDRCRQPRVPLVDLPLSCALDGDQPLALVAGKDGAALCGRSGPRDAGRAVAAGLVCDQWIAACGTGVDHGPHLRDAEVARELGYLLTQVAEVDGVTEEVPDREGVTEVEDVPDTEDVLDGVIVMEVEDVLVTDAVTDGVTEEVIDAVIEGVGVDVRVVVGVSVLIDDGDK